MVGIMCSRGSSGDKSLTCEMTSSSNAYIFKDAKFTLSGSKVNAISAKVISQKNTLQGSQK